MPTCRFAGEKTVATPPRRGFVGRPVADLLAALVDSATMTGTAMTCHLRQPRRFNAGQGEPPHDAVLTRRDKRRRHYGFR